MRIGQFTDSFLPIVDGVGRVVYSYADTLSRMGHPCTVFAPMADMGFRGDYPFDVIDYSASNMPGKLPYRIGLPKFDDHFEQRVHMTELDIVHVHAPFLAGRAGLNHAKKQRLPTVGTFHSKYYDDFLVTTKSKTIAKLGVREVVRFFERCDEVWAVSEASGETLREYGYRSSVVVMPNGTQIRALDERVLPALSARYAPDGEPILFFCGQLNWKKNILRILQAAKILREEGKRFRLVLAGQGPDREEIERRAATLGVADRTVFTGHVTETRELDGLYALARAFVFPSLYDNGPMVVREAAAMGTPSVLIADSSAAESVTDGVNALTCADTAESLADALRRLLEDEALANALGARARETIPVPWEALMHRAVERYQALIDRRGRA